MTRKYSERRDIFRTAGWLLVFAAAAVAFCLFVLAL